MAELAHEFHSDEVYQQRTPQDQIDLVQARQDFLNNLPKIEDITQAILNHQNR
jgi:hypothetical protein